MSVNRPLPPRRPGSGPTRATRATPQPAPPIARAQTYDPSQADREEESTGSSVPPQLIVAASIVGVIVLAAIISGISSGGKSSARLPEDPADKYEDSSEAFSSKGSTAAKTGGGGTSGGASAAAPAAVGSEAEETKVIKAAVDRYTKAIADEDYDKAADFFDAERILQEIQSMGMLTGLSGRDRGQFATAFRNNMKKTLAGAGDGMAYAKVDVRKVKPQSDQTEVIAYVLANHAYGPKLKQRWWMKKRGKTWRVFDMENLEDGTRITTVMGVALEATQGGNIAPWLLKQGDFHEVASSLQAEDYDGAAEAMRELEGVDFPKQIRVLVVGMKGAIALGQEKPDDALKFFDEAQGIQVDLPYINRQRAIAHNMKGEYDKALGFAKKYLEMLGDDAKAWHAMGEAYEGLGKRGEALEAYRKGHDDVPSFVENMSAIARLLTPDKKGELTTRFAKTVKESPDKGEAFAYVATDLENGEMLDALVAAYRKAGGKGYGVNFHDARAKLMLGKYEEAHKLLQPMVAKAPEEDKKDVLGMLVEAAAGTGKWQEAYQTIPDPADAVQRIGRVLTEQGKSADLKTLAEMHKAKMPDDGHVPYFVGKALMIEKDYAKAGDQFAAALKVAKNDEERARFRDGFVAARYKGGKGVEAHAEAPQQDKTAVFNLLAEMMYADKDAANLAKLVQSQGNTVGVTPAYHWNQARAMWLKNEHAKAAELLVQHREAIIQEDPARSKAVAEMVVRSLVRQKKYEEAKKELAKFGEGADPMLGAMVAICSLNPATATKAVGDYVKDDPSGDALRRLYADPEIGPALRTPDLFMVKVKYPEPAAKAAPAPATRKS
jgi:tetratricopeptide (TPR) repeat protein